MAIDPIAIVEGAAKADEIVRGIIGAAEESDRDRVTVTQFENRTDCRFIYKNSHTPDGVWITDKEPPHEIPPQSVAFWGGQDSGWWTGTKGWVRYTAKDVLPEDNNALSGNHLALMIGWDNPYIGGGDENYIKIFRPAVARRDGKEFELFFQTFPVDGFYTESFVTGRKDGRRNTARLIPE